MVGVFRTRADVEAKLHTNCIAVVPALAEPPLKRLQAPAKKALRVQGPIPALSWHVIDAPFSRFSEAMRAVKLAIDLNEEDKRNRVIGFTSTMPNEGKSTIAASLAQLIAHGGTSTILVDCDLRNPSLTRLLAPEATSGFFDLISGDMRLSDVVLHDESTGLQFLPQSMKTRFAHTHEALASQSTIQLFDELRNQYEYVLVDCAPLMPVVDAVATTLFIDSYVYVIEWGQTRFEVVHDAFKGAGGVYEKLLGAILNKVEIKTLGRYDGYGASYYQNKAYAKYGYTD
jgi:succinoglycan biosynthesis transport protein ExoP